MTHQQQVDLLAECRVRWVRIRRLCFGHVRLPSQDWDDIEAAAYRRVFAKYGTYDGRRPRATWLHVVMRRAVINELRRHLPDKRIPAHKWRTLFQRARRIETRVVEVDEWGDEQVVVEPDLIAPATGVDDKRVAEFRETLPAADRRLLDLAMAAPTYRGFDRELGGKKQFATEGYNAIRRLATLYREFAR